MPMQHAEILALAGLRVDGRREDDVRTVRFTIGVASQADGSVYLEQGLNKVLVLVHGPHEPDGGGGSEDRASLEVEVEQSAFSGTERKKRRIGDRKTAEVENIIKQTLQEVVMLELYPKSTITVVVHVLASDGSTVCAALNAACLALMSCGISMTDMVVACSIGIVNGKVCQDLTQVEQSSEGAFLPVAIRASSEEIIMMQLDQRLSLALCETALQQAVDGCRKIRQVMDRGMRDHLRLVLLAQRGGGIGEEGEEEKAGREA